MWVEDKLCIIKAFRFECLENLPAFIRQERPSQACSVMSFPHTHLCLSHIYEPNRSPIAIMTCWFDSFNRKFLHGKTFNHWEPNLSWNALNLFRSVGSTRKIKSAISLSKIDSVQFFGFHFPEPFQFFASTAEAKKAGKASRRAEETPKPHLAAGRTAMYIKKNKLARTDPSGT